MNPRFHIKGTEKFGYSLARKYLHSYYIFLNTVQRARRLHPNSSINDIKGYAAYFCYIRLKSFNTFLRVATEHKDYVTANCIMRMLGDSVAVFHLVYREPDKNLRILRHCLYVLDGCKENLGVLQEIKEGALPEEERIKVNESIHINIEHRKQMMREAQEMLDQSPLKVKDKAAFETIVKNYNWKFKEFRDYNDRNPKENRYRWNELYERIRYCEGYDLLTFISQYVHGLSMSNLIINFNDNNCDTVIGEALGLLDRMNVYALEFFNDENFEILIGLFNPEIRDAILACYVDEHRPSIEEWERGLLGGRF